MKESSSRMDGCWREQRWFARLEPRFLRLLSASMWPKSEDASAPCRICELKDKRTHGPWEIVHSSSTRSITNRHPQPRNSQNARAVKRRSTSSEFCEVSPPNRSASKHWDNCAPLEVTKLSRKCSGCASR